MRDGISDIKRLATALEVLRAARRLLISKAPSEAKPNRKQKLHRQNKEKKKNPWQVNSGSLLISASQRVPKG
jgi:hypothetical protein